MDDFTKKRIMKIMDSYTTKQSTSSFKKPD